METTQRVPIVSGDKKVGSRVIHDTYYKKHVPELTRQYAQLGRGLEHLPSIMNAIQSKNPSSDSVDIFSLFSGSGSNSLGSGSIGTRAIEHVPQATSRFPNGYYEIGGERFPLP